MQLALVIAAGLVGLVVGSFANVAIHRWPQGRTVGDPKRSVCPDCGAAIRPTDNLPVVSWIVLRGRCRDCGARIPPRYLVVELATGTLFASVVLVWGPDPLVPALLVFTWALVVATAIDLEHRIIPNRLTYRLPLVLLPLVAIAAVWDGAWGDLRRGAIAGLAVPAVMLLLSEAFRLLRGQPGIGMGDVKLAISIGLVVGYLGGLELVVFAYSSVIGAVVIALGLVVAGRAKLATRIPFGPYLAVGSLVPVLAGAPAVRLVERVLGL